MSDHSLLIAILVFLVFQQRQGGREMDPILALVLGGVLLGKGWFFTMLAIWCLFKIPTFVRLMVREHRAEVAREAEYRARRAAGAKRRRQMVADWFRGAKKEAA